MMAWGLFGTGASLLMSWGQQMTRAAILDDVESFQAAGSIEMAGKVVPDTVGRLWEVDKVFAVAEKGFVNSNSIKGGAGGMSALNATCFLSSGFVRLDNVAMVVPGMFSVIDGLGDMSTVVGGVVFCCGRGRKLVWVGCWLLWVWTCFQA
jgi:hypothetical protein